MDMMLAHNRPMETWSLFRGGLRAKTVFDIIPDGISIQDKDHNIFIANQSLANVFDIPVEELVGKKCCEVYPPEVCAHCPLIEAQGTNNTVIKRGGYEVQAYPLIDDGGEVKGVLGYVRDITRQSEMQSQLSHAVRQGSHPPDGELAELGRLTSIMSHEVRNPLSVIQMSVGYLLDQLDTDGSASKAKKHLQIIREETERANRIIQDIAAYTKPPASHYERINIGTQVRLALMKASVELNEKNIEVIENIDRNPIMVEMGKDHLQQVLQNLLKNACQAMSAGGRLTVSTSCTGRDARAPRKFAEIRISDTGGGIAEEKIGEIFDLFFTTKRDGMGLGLYISRRLVERYQGEMVVQNRRGDGATFVIRLPIGA